MKGDLFEEGGPHQIKRSGQDQYTMKISIPLDSDGLQAHECPQVGCAPAYFKVKLGTGLAGETEIFCPYCRLKAAPTQFYSQGQLDYAKKIALGEAQKGIHKFLADTFDLGPTGKKTIGGGFLTMKMEYKPAPTPVIRRPVEEELRRDVICPHCTLSHSVYGLATWCSDCGKDIFLTHVEAEFEVISKMLGDLERRREQLGARVAARDIENALEDTVSIFEAVLKVIARRHLVNRGMQQVEVDEFLSKKIATRFQNILIAAEVCQRELGFDLLGGLTAQDSEKLKETFEKRHPITHNLGIVDAKYLQKARAGELQGRDVRVTATDVELSIASARSVLTAAYHCLFPADGKP